MGKLDYLGCFIVDCEKEMEFAIMHATELINTYISLKVTEEMGKNECKPPSINAPFARELFETKLEYKEASKENINRLYIQIASGADGYESASGIYNDVITLLTEKLNSNSKFLIVKEQMNRMSAGYATLGELILGILKSDKVPISEIDDVFAEKIGPYIVRKRIDNAIIACKDREIIKKLKKIYDKEKVSVEISWPHSNKEDPMFS